MTYSVQNNTFHKIQMMPLAPNSTFQRTQMVCSTQNMLCNRKCIYILEAYQVPLIDLDYVLCKKLFILTIVILGFEKM